MPLEVATYINGLVAANPDGNDPKSLGDNHIRLVKSTLKNTFPNITGAVTPTHTELNYVDGVISPLQAQIDLKSPINNPTFTGTVTLPADTTIGTVSPSEILTLDGVTSPIQTQLNTLDTDKAPKASPTFTGTVTLPPTTSIGTVSAAEIATLDGVTSAIQTQLDQLTLLKAPLASPALTGVPTAPTAAANTATTQIATTAFVAAQAFINVLPGQAGNGGKFVTTDGVSASWAFPGVIIPEAKAANYLVLITDRLKLFDCTGSFTLSFDNPATLTANWFAYVRNSGSGDITISATVGSIDGLSSYIMYPNEVRLFYCDGITLTSVVLQPFRKQFNTSGNFTKPPGYTSFSGLLWGGGGGGGKGDATGSGGGGGGGSCVQMYFDPAALPTTVAVGIGSGGAGAVATGSGGLGGNTTFGALATAYAGGGGGGVAGANNAAGGGGGGVLGAGASASGVLAGSAGAPTSSPNAQFGGGQGSAGVIICAAVYGGAGGAQGKNVAVGNAGSVSLFGGGSGGGSATVTPGAGGASSFAGAGGAGGTAALSGSDGVAPAGGGGGTVNGAKGGDGAPGRVIIWGS